MTKFTVIGDSITDWNPRKDFNNLGIAGNTTVNLIERLDDVLNKSKEQDCYLFIGVNDFLKEIGEPEDTKKRYIYIVEELLKVANSLKLMSVLPLGPNYDYNKEVNWLNNEINKIAKEYKIEYINVRKNLEDENGYLNKDYTTDDIHLNEEGYRLLNERF